VIEATPNGSSITGTLTLKEPAKFRQVIIKDKENQPLAKLLIENPETVLRLIVLYGGWVPHPPKREVVVEEIRSPCDISTEGHPVQVYDEREKKVVTAYYACDKVRYQVKEGCPPCTGLNERHHILALGFYLGPSPQGCSITHIRDSGCETWVDVWGPGMPAKVEPEALCMTKRIYNDSNKTKPEPPPQFYQTRYVLQTMVLPSREDVAPADRCILDDLENLQKRKPEDQTGVMADYEARPYSQGCVHWHLSAGTEIRALLAYPVQKVEKKGGDWFQRFVVEALRIVASGIFGAHNPKKNRLVDAFIDAWTKDVSQRQEVKEVLKVGDLKFYGDIWVLYLSPAFVRVVDGKVIPDPTPREMWIGNITQDVYVQIVVVRPDGTKVPVAGSVTFKCKEAITTPSPPSPPFTSIKEFIPEEGKTVSLAKGWQWEPTVTNVGPEPRTFPPIEVPLKPPSITFEVPSPQQPPGGEGS